MPPQIARESYRENHITQRVFTARVTGRRDDASRATDGLLLSCGRAVAARRIGEEYHLPNLIISDFGFALLTA